MQKTNKVLRKDPTVPASSSLFDVEIAAKIVAVKVLDWDALKGRVEDFVAALHGQNNARAWFAGGVMTVGITIDGKNFVADPENAVSRATRMNCQN